MDVFVYVFITLISLYVLSWICGAIYLIHPFIQVPCLVLS